MVRSAKATGRMGGNVLTVSCRVTVNGGWMGSNRKGDACVCTEGLRYENGCVVNMSALFRGSESGEDSARIGIKEELSITSQRSCFIY